MEHLAILNKKWKLLTKILSGEKTIESRWGNKYKKTLYNKIKKNDIIYFKESGKPVTVKAIVKKVLFFNNLNKNKIKQILQNYGKQICIPNFYIAEVFRKNFCVLIFLKDVHKIKPFNINKKGYGIMTSWICIDGINKLKK